MAAVRPFKLAHVNGMPQDELLHSRQVEIATYTSSDLHKDPED